MGIWENLFLGTNQTRKIWFKTFKLNWCYSHVLVLSLKKLLLHYSISFPSHRSMRTAKSRVSVVNAQVNRVVLESSWPNILIDNIVEGVHLHMSSTNLGRDLRSDLHLGGCGRCHTVCDVKGHKAELVICYSGGND